MIRTGPVRQTSILLRMMQAFRWSTPAAAGPLAWNICWPDSKTGICPWNGFTQSFCHTRTRIIWVHSDRYSRRQGQKYSSILWMRILLSTPANCRKRSITISRIHCCIFFRGALLRKAIWWNSSRRAGSKGRDGGLKFCKIQENRLRWFEFFRTRIYADGHGLDISFRQCCRQG